MELVHFFKILLKSYTSNCTVISNPTEAWCLHDTWTEDTNYINRKLFSIYLLFSVSITTSELLKSTNRKFLAGMFSFYRHLTLPYIFQDIHISISSNVLTSFGSLINEWKLFTWYTRRFVLRDPLYTHYPTTAVFFWWYKCYRFTVLAGTLFARTVAQLLVCSWLVTICYNIQNTLIINNMYKSPELGWVLVPNQQTTLNSTEHNFLALQCIHLRKRSYRAQRIYKKASETWIHVTDVFWKIRRKSKRWFQLQIVLILFTN